MTDPKLDSTPGSTPDMPDSTEGAMADPQTHLDTDPVNQPVNQPAEADENGEAGEVPGSGS